jgi:hypothetical protein
MKELNICDISNLETKLDPEDMEILLKLDPNIIYQMTTRQFHKN